MVPRARRFVRSSLAGEPAYLISNAELVVSELVTNASLHAAPPIVVRLFLEDGIRIEVEDEGPGLPILTRPNLDAMTGRGLSMVGAVTSRWGVEPAGPERKVVWAELGTPGPSNPSVDVESMLAARPDPAYRIELGPVSTELLLAAKAHMDNVVRELVLLREGEASSGVALSPAVAALVETVTVDFAEARTEIKRQAAAAAARGDPVTNLVLHLSPQAADAGERYLAALDQVDRYARAAHLLTLAPPAEHRLFRRWYVQTLVTQLRACAHGDPPPPYRPFEMVLAQEVGRLSRVERIAGRHELLGRIRGSLAKVQSAQEMASVVVDHAVEFVGVEAAGVRFLGEDGMLRPIAYRGPGLRTDPDADVPIESELPIAVAARKNEPLTTPSGPDRTSYLMPLVARDQTLGLLTVTFLAGELVPDAELALAESLAGTLAEALPDNLTSTDSPNGRAAHLPAATDPPGSTA